MHQCRDSADRRIAAMIERVEQVDAINENP
jgi:hypothetical protein